MKDKIGTTDIKILVDRLDFGEKHGKDTDAMTKNWLTSSKAYLDDVIRKKREMDGYRNRAVKPRPLALNVL